MVQAIIHFKKGGVAIILAFLFGLFPFNGVVPKYTGRGRRGVGITPLRWFAYPVILLVIIFAVGLNIGQFSVAKENMPGLIIIRRVHLLILPLNNYF